MKGWNLPTFMACFDFGTFIIAIIIIFLLKTYWLNTQSVHITCRMSSRNLQLLDFFAMIHHGYTMYLPTKFHTPSSYISFVIYFKTRPQEIHLKASFVLFYVTKRVALTHLHANKDNFSAIRRRQCRSHLSQYCDSPVITDYKFSDYIFYDVYTTCCE